MVSLTMVSLTMVSSTLVGLTMVSLTRVGLVCVGVVWGYMCSRGTCVGQVAVVCLGDADEVTRTECLGLSSRDGRGDDVAEHGSRVGHKFTRGRV